MVRIPLAVPQLGRGRPLIEELDGVAILSLSNGPDQLASLALKRLIDIVGAVLGLIVLSPVLLVVALYILLKDGRPVLFVQTRVGVHGRTFEMRKFRTMVRDAEERYDEVAWLFDPGPGVQAQGRSARGAVGPRPAPHQPRRAAPAVERAAGTFVAPTPPGPRMRLWMCRHACLKPAAVLSARPMPHGNHGAFISCANFSSTIPPQAFASRAHRRMYASWTPAMMLAYEKVRKGSSSCAGIAGSTGSQNTCGTTRRAFRPSMSARGNAALEPPQALHGPDGRCSPDAGREGIQGRDAGIGVLGHAQGDLSDRGGGRGCLRTDRLDGLRGEGE